MRYAQMAGQGTFIQSSPRESCKETFARILDFDEEKATRCQIFWVWDIWSGSGSPRKSIEKVRALLQTMIIRMLICCNSRRRVRSRETR